MRIFVAIFLAVLLAAAPVSEAASPKQVRKVAQLKKSAAEFLTRGKYKEAIPLLEKILSINPTDKAASRHLTVARRQTVESICKKADESYMGGEYEKAIAEWERILEINPEDARVEQMIEMTRNLLHDDTLKAMYILVEDLLRQGKYDIAVTELEKILLISPDEKRARELLASSKETVANTEINEYYAKAEIFMKEEKYDVAIEQWKAILEIDETQEEASRLIAAARRTKMNSMYSKAKKLYEKGNYIASRDLYYKIRAENPTDLDVKKIISRLDETISVVQKLGDKGVDWDFLRKALANHIKLKGSSKAAIVASWYAIQLNPGNETAYAVRDFLEKSHISDVRALEPPVRDMNIIDQYLFAALNHIYEGRYDLAVQESSIVIALQPDNTLAHKRLGSAYFALGNKDKAREAWKKALKLSPDDKELKQFMKVLK
jgi:tetratricopeptide (TPR) repeat protein